ncbi:MAG: prolipoprotein diacylglyceryl transferase [Actinomycetota bacterium]|nr:prolipoprotein diacylglyceryl transferase [Actinomycetota bacterium]
MEFTLLGSAAVAIGSFWLIIRWEAKRGNAAGCAVDIWDAGLAAVIGGVLVGRLVSMISAGISPFSDPGQILLVRSGVSTVGATIGAIAVYVFVTRRDLASGLDAIAPAALAGLAGWHAGCLVTNSCLGAESTLPWAMTLDGSAVTRHPVELYAAILLAVAAVLIARWKERGRPPEFAPAATALLAAGGTRLVTEPMRISLSGGPVWFYGAGCVVGTAILMWSLRRSRN